MISFLVAVYNSEKWLRQCLDSLLQQDFDIEVIAVNDASTDGSAAILDAYAAKDSRLQVVHLEQNGGQAKARNIALSMAKGEWVTMLDSDDRIGDLSSAVDLAKRDDIDCIVLQMDHVYADGSAKRFPLSRREWTPQQAACEAILWQGIHGLYLIRTEIHRQYTYDEAAMLYSDDNTARLHYLHSRKIVACDTVYYYRQHEESTTKKLSIKLFDIIPAHTSLQHTLDKDPLATEEMRQTLRNLRWRELIDRWFIYFTNRQYFLPQKRIIEPLLRSLYKELINENITDPVRWHFGFWKIRPYALFRLQVKTYFRLKKLVHSV